jgi:hypothetical protein
MVICLSHYRGGFPKPTSISTGAGQKWYDRGIMTARGWTTSGALACLLLGAKVFGQQATPSPVGQFECRNWESQPTVLLAFLVLQGDGTYQATDKVDDLTAHRPSTKGHYVYDQSEQKINWTSGDWQNRVGTYMPQVKGTDFVVVHTKRDPEGQVDGVLRCARTPKAK